MALRKTAKADVKSKYRLFIQLGLLVALLLVWVGFTANFEKQEAEVIDIQDQEVIQMEEIQQTQQIQAAPPPPAPPVPIEVPDDAIIEEEFEFDSDLDLEESLDLPQAPPAPPPPPKEEDEPEPEPEEPEIFVVVEQMPEPTISLAEIQKLIEYPEMARRAGVEGMVTLQFVVDEQGNVVNPVVTRGIGAGCDEEALRVIKTVKFKPGMQRGKPVKVQFALPIRFKLR